MKKHNEYELMVGSQLYRAIPKTVLAAIVVSLINLRGDSDGNEIIGKEGDGGEITRAIYDEWCALHTNGIVPQKPPNGAL